MTKQLHFGEFDVGIVGGGPAGLSAAVVLGRCRRRVVLFDHGQPRNAAACGVHCFLGLDGIPPSELRDRGRQEAEAYGVQMEDGEVVRVANLDSPDHPMRFAVATHKAEFRFRALLLATGVVDLLPDIPNIRQFYGRSVHHCPYCDGWEHRDGRLVAFASGSKAVDLAQSLRTLSPHVTACSHGGTLSPDERQILRKNGVAFREEVVTGLKGRDGILEDVTFESGPALPCDALFFSSGQGQRSSLAKTLGCECDAQGLIKTGKKQGTGIKGLYLAGDADGEVQFAVVAAAEGAVAATAINGLLQEEDLN